MNVLILDDREEDLAALDSIIASRGHAVTRALSGEEGLRALRKAAADLIICDAVMEGMDGATLLKEVRKDHATARIPFYVTTAVMVEPEDEKFFFELGASGIIRKPFDARIIHKVLEDAAPGAGRLGLGPPTPRPMGDDTFVERYTDRLVNKLEKRVVDLQASMRLLDETLNAVDQPLFVIGDDFRIVRANAAAARRLAAASAAELAGKSCYRAIYGAQTPCAFADHACPLRQVIVEKKNVRHEAAIDTPSLSGRFAITFNPCVVHPDSRPTLVEQIFEAAAAGAQAVPPATHDLKNSLTGIVGYAQVLLDETPADSPHRATVEALWRLADRVVTGARTGRGEDEKPAAESPKPKAQARQAKKQISMAPTRALEPPPEVAPPAQEPEPPKKAETTPPPPAPAAEPDPAGVALPRVTASTPPVVMGTVQTRTPPVGTVLFVDDEEALLDVGKKILEKHRLIVVTAADADEALIIFEARRDEIDLVVLDLMLPGADGASTFEQFMAIDNEARVLLVGPAGGPHAAPLTARGALGFLPKPYDAGALLAAVQEGLAKPLPPEKALRKSQIPRKTRMRVLIVDDEEIVLRTLDRGLRRDFDIVTISSAQAAMDLLGLDRDFDWLISDLNMPERNGLDLYDYVGSKVPALAGRFVMLTGGAATLDLAERLEALNLPSYDKPVRSDVLGAFLKGEPPPQE